jgi:CheY-like chemotaxis protein
LARRVRTDLGSRVHLVALTGYGQPEDRERARAAGFDDHVTKPLDLATLERVLGKAAALRNSGSTTTAAPVPRLTARRPAG